jgi:hypothetical protein
LEQAVVSLRSKLDKNIFEDLRVSESCVLRRIFGIKRDEVTGAWRKFYNEEFRKFVIN